MSCSINISCQPAKVVELHEKVRAFLQKVGVPRREAQLLASSQIGASVIIRQEMPETVKHSARREGLYTCSTPEGLSLSGNLLAYQNLLCRWPEPAVADCGASLASLLGLEFAIATPTKWPRGSIAGWGTRTFVMGVLNATPDSFSDGGRYLSVENALQHAREMIAAGVDIIDVGGESTRQHAREMIAAGVDIIDVGGESTRPGADWVSAAQEVERVVPVIRALSEEVSVPISIDTYKPEVARAALAAGASIINDINGLRQAEMLSLAAETGVPVILMHMQGEPRTVQQNPSYQNVVAEVLDWLEQACNRAQAAGVKREQLIIDPGIGFGKTTEHNLMLLRRLRDLRILGYPILVGTSRKSLVGNVLQLPVDQRSEGTAATVAAAILQGADIVRVHDVEAMRRVAVMSDAIANVGDN
jgi:dihydropteroate synthase